MIVNLLSYGNNWWSTHKLLGVRNEKQSKWLYHTGHFLSWSNQIPWVYVYVSNSQILVNGIIGWYPGWNLGDNVDKWHRPTWSILFSSDTALPEVFSSQVTPPYLKYCWQVTPPYLKYSLLKWHRPTWSILFSSDTALPEVLLTSDTALPEILLTSDTALPEVFSSQVTPPYLKYCWQVTLPYLKYSLIKWHRPTWSILFSSDTALPEVFASRDSQSGCEDGTHRRIPCPRSVATSPAWWRALCTQSGIPWPSGRECRCVLSSPLAGFSWSRRRPRGTRDSLAYPGWCSRSWWVKQ